MVPIIYRTLLWVLLIGIGGCSEQIWKLQLENNTNVYSDNDTKNIIITKTNNNTETNLLITSLASKYSKRIAIYDKDNINNGLETNYLFASSFSIPNFKKSETQNIIIDFKCVRKYSFLPHDVTYTLKQYSRSSSYTSSRSGTSSPPSNINSTERVVDVNNIKGKFNYTIDCKLKLNEDNYRSVDFKIVDIVDRDKNYANHPLNHPLNQLINSVVDYIDKKLSLNEKSYSDFETIFYNFDYKVHRFLINRSYDKSINRLSLLESNKENKTHELYYTLGLTYHLIGNLNLAKKYYLKSLDLYDGQEVNYPELALKLIK
jgi:hypothetical protein